LIKRGPIDLKSKNTDTPFSKDYTAGHQEQTRMSNSEPNYVMSFGNDKNSVEITNQNSSHKALDDIKSFQSTSEPKNDENAPLEKSIPSVNEQAQIKTLVEARDYKLEFETEINACSGADSLPPIPITKTKPFFAPKRGVSLALGENSRSAHPQLSTSNISQHSSELDASKGT
jgi:hypothetical protein